MPATVTNLREAGRVLGPGLLWGGIPTPAAAARITLAPADADGFVTPETVANPLAYPIGGTTGGSTLKAGVTGNTDLFIDEITAAVDRIRGQGEMSIATNLIGVADAVVTKLLMSGFGTQTTAAGYVQNTIGTAPEVFTGIVLIAPRRDDATKVMIFHIYRAINDSGWEAGVNRTGLASSPALFKGYAVSGRSVLDQLGNWWWQAV